MPTKDKERSLLEIAIDVVGSHKKPQTIFAIAKEAMEIKGLKTAQGQEQLARFICDFMESGYFVYVGEGQWDLKERQPSSILDKDISDSDYIGSDDSDVAANELRSTEDGAEEAVNPTAAATVDDIEPETEEDEISSMLKESDDYQNNEPARVDITEVQPEDGVELGYEENEGEDEE